MPPHADQQDVGMTVAVPDLGQRFRAAVTFAVEVHGAQRRSGTGIPYLAHVLVVCGLVIEDGGDEDQAIAALLHDAVDDRGGRGMLDRIAAEFGERVGAIIAACSDSPDGRSSEPWIARKRRYLAQLPYVTDDAVLRVVLADKVNNARSLVRDYRQEGQALWQRFEQKTARDQLWYYSGLLEFFERRRPGPLTGDLERAVDELAWLIARDPAQPLRGDTLGARARAGVAQLALELYARLGDRGRTGLRVARRVDAAAPARPRADRG
jgi:HD domain